MTAFDRGPGGSGGPAGDAAADPALPNTVSLRLDERSLRLGSPLGTANGEISERRVVLVAVEGALPDGTPVRGVGEAAPLPPWTETYDECRSALAGVRDALGRGESAPLDGLPPAARHALSLASADGEARAAGVPLSRVVARRAAIDGAPAGSVPVNATVGDGSAEAAVEAAESAVEEGFDCLKVKVGARAVDADLDRLRAVREAVGDGVRLRADANGGWSREEAERAVDAIADAGLGLEYVEQPVGAGEHDALRALRGRGVPVAVDETVNGGGDGRAWPDPIEAHADVAVLKPMAQGGPARAAAAARRLRGRAVPSVVTTTVDAAVARTAAVHVAAAASVGGDLAHGLATGSLLAEDVVAADPAPVEGGRVAVPEGPGVAGDAFADLL